jgi:MoaA/NifB/PqqE/SkfB family radical SAM enzyme
MEHYSMITQRYGGLKIFWHDKKMKSFLEEKITAPLHVRVKPTNRCNHKCAFCSYDPQTGDIGVRNEANRTDELPKEKIHEILEDFREIGVKAITFSGGGEPLIYPHIKTAMEKTLNYGINLAIITNGQKLNGRRADILANANWVRISSDASDANVFSKSRKVPNADFDELTDNIRNFAKIKNPKCELGINYVVHHLNADQVYRSVKHFKDLGVNHIKICPQWVTNFIEYHSPIKDSVIEQIGKAKSELEEIGRFEVYDTYANDFSLSSVPERKYDRCYVMQFNPVIGANSKVYFCHDKAYSTSGILGSIKDQRFKDLWFSEEARQKFLKFNPKESCPHHCTNDSKNIRVMSALDCYGDDVNFV